VIRESWRRTLKEESLGGGLIRSSVDMIVTMYLSSGNMGKKLKWSEVGRKINSLRFYFIFLFFLNHIVFTLIRV
jgi:hypothetical protein